VRARALLPAACPTFVGLAASSIGRGLLHPSPCTTKLCINTSRWPGWQGMMALHMNHSAVGAASAMQARHAATICACITAVVLMGASALQGQEFAHGGMQALCGTGAPAPATGP
jgi:hypothetical protein